MAIRNVIECDFCGEEVDDEYYIIKAREFGTLANIFNDWETGYKRRFIICDECRHRVKEMLIRLSERKKRKKEV